MTAATISAAADAGTLDTTPRRRGRIPAANHTRLYAGPADTVSLQQALALVAELPTWSNRPAKEHATRRRGATTVLTWLMGHPGSGWRERWQSSGADDTLSWIDAITDRDDPRAATTKHIEVIAGLIALVLCRVILPGYGFITAYKAGGLFIQARQLRRPDLFARLEEAAVEQRMRPSHVTEGVRTITKLVIHTGREVDQLTVGDLHEYREWREQAVKRTKQGPHAAWDLLRGIGVIPRDVSLPEALRPAPRTTAELVDLYQIRNPAIRDVLIRYLDERRPSLDFASLRSITGVLAGLFWADIERHHPGIDTLRLPTAIVEAWKQRLRTLKRVDVAGQPRRGIRMVFTTVRAFYLDIAEWALEDPSWVASAAPSPVRKSDTAGQAKHKRTTTAEIHQRIRERLPHLPTLIACAERHRDEQATFLTATTATRIGAEFDHSGRGYRRITSRASTKDPARHSTAEALVEDIITGERTNVALAEDHAFWSWAVIEVLRHTGVRIEELLEITHLALVSYRLPDTGELMPMLQIVPSKTNEERLLLVSPELASVLATIITRLRAQNGGTVRLVARYDTGEQVTGPPLPHLFQRRRAWRSAAISYAFVQTMLTDTLARTGLRDAADRPLTHTPHDFRRMFATEAVTGGLPVHIAARLLGHHSLSTTQAYLAVFQDDLVRTYRAFLDQRRAVRPEAEYREPTDEEWTQFQQHFELRKVELGTCSRPYASPCRHEHACIRCPMLRVDPRQRPRLAEIIANLNDRIAEARINGWRGEIEGLQVSRDAATAKLLNIDRGRPSTRANITELGIPVIRGDQEPKT
jgi:site-specific recombinase XerD